MSSCMIGMTFLSKPNVTVIPAVLSTESRAVWTNKAAAQVHKQTSLQVKIKNF